MSNPETNTHRRKTWLGSLVALAVLLTAGGLVVGFMKRDETPEIPTNTATFAARRGPLTISVLESGTIKAREQIILKSEVEGHSTIITLIDEGTRVKKGDLLVELDVSSLVDERIDQEIRVQNAEADYVNARENLAVVNNQGQSDIEKADLTLKFAREDLRQYDVNDGLFAKDRKEIEARIQLAQEELQRARDVNQWSERLYREKYISETEYMADKLTVNRRQMDVDLAASDLKILKDFTYKRQIAQLTSDAHQAEMALERTKRKAKADQAQAQARLIAREAELKRQKAKLAKIEAQIAKGKIYAPADGLVIYATTARRGGWRRSEEPMDEGQEVSEGQELIYLPVGTSTLAEVDIHEASLKKMRKGLPAVVTVDALAGRRFMGSLDFIAPLPDPTSMWINPDLKVYNAQVFIDEEDPTLRTGMSCKVEIIVEQYQDAIYVPVQAVINVAGQPTVYVLHDNVVSERAVEIGLDNNRMVRVTSGLQEGEQVLLSPPLKAATASDSMEGSNENSQQEADFQQRIREQIEASRQNSPNDLRPTPPDAETLRPSESPARRNRGGRP